MKQKTIQIPWHMEIELRDQVRLLEEVEENKELLNTFSRVISAGFNVIPLKVTPDSITVATNFHYNPKVIDVLSKIFNKKIDVERINETLIFAFIERNYLKGTTINFSTFLEEDFLSNPENYKNLTKEKVDDAGSCNNFLPKDKLLIISLTVDSKLTNIDRPIISTVMSDVNLDTGFEVTNDRIQLYNRSVSDEAIILLRKFVRYSGLEFTYDIITKEVKDLPYYIHPTEVQITSIDYDGRTSFYVYDHTEKLEPGEKAKWSLCYYFLCYGYRHRRELTVSVDLIKVVNKSNVTIRKGEPVLTISDLKRWLGE